MESPHPQFRGGLFAYKLLNALAHLAGRFVSESKSENAPGLIAAIEKMDYLVGQDTCLTRPGPRNHKRRAAGIYHCVTLLFIEIIEILLQDTDQLFSFKILSKAFQSGSSGVGAVMETSL